MVHACTGGSASVDVQRIVDAADGVPFLVEELLASPGVPQTFAETVQRRLEPLAATTRTVLASAATLGRHFDWHLLAAATELDDAMVAEALEQALAAQLVAIEGDAFRFRHALTRDAVLDTVLPPRRPAIAAAALAAPRPLVTSVGPTRAGGPLPPRRGGRRAGNNRSRPHAVGSRAARRGGPSPSSVSRVESPRCSRSCTKDLPTRRSPSGSTCHPAPSRSTSRACCGRPRRAAARSWRRLPIKPTAARRR
jgi:hypothetical protein